MIAKFLLSLVISCLTLGAQASHMELSIDRYIMNHRFGLHALTVNVEMSGSSIVCEDKVTKDIKAFLAGYPNQEDYWEIVNKQLTVFLSKRYPGQQILTLLSIEPDCAKPYMRKSICQLIDGEITQQTFSFNILNHPFKDNLVSINVEIAYDANASTSDYINFFSVRDAIEAFIKENSLLGLPDSLLPEEIAKHLLIRFSSATGFSVVLEIPSHACNPAKCCWKATLFQEENSNS